jgi:hypothetical protein
MRFYLSLLLLLIGATVASAQTATEISGHVIDQRNASVKGAEVRLIPRTGTTLVAATNADGNFTFANVLAGDYVLEIKASGFASVALPIALLRGQSLTKDDVIGRGG